jgi:hypothetical protein
MSPPPEVPGSPRMERRHHGEKCPYLETFLAYLPGSTMKELHPRPPPWSLCRESCSIPQSPFIQLSKFLIDEPSSRFLKRGPYGKRCLSSEPFLHKFWGPQQGSPPTRFPSQSSHRERHHTSRAPFNHISKSLLDEPTPGCPIEPP